jgi:hypothetical protein
LILLSGRVAFSGARGFGDEVFTEKTCRVQARFFCAFIGIFEGGRGETVRKQWQFDGEIAVKWVIYVDK